MKLKLFLYCYFCHFALHFDENVLDCRNIADVFRKWKTTRIFAGFVAKSCENSIKIPKPNQLFDIYALKKTDSLDARKLRAVEAGALEALISAMRWHRWNEAVQEKGCAAVAYVCSCTDRRAEQRALDAGVRNVFTYAMQDFPNNANIAKLIF